MQCVREREANPMNLSQSLPTQMSSSEPNLSQSNMMEQQLDNLADAMTDMCVEEVS